ncbi:hypothetical protein D9M68_720860 [compost metagenome]
MRSRRPNGSSPTKPPCRRSLPAPDRRRQPIYGPTPGMIDHLAAAVRRWWPTVLRTVGPASASPGISRATAAFSRSTVMPPTTSWSAPMAAMTASHWLAAGHTVGASSMSCMSAKAPRLQRRRSSGWQSSGRSRRPCAAKALTPASPRVSKPPPRSSPSSSPYGRRPCRGSPANRSSPRRSVTPSRVAPSSNAS